MPTTLTNGIQLPDKGSVDWYNSMQSNYNLIDTHLGNTDIHVTAEDKANWDSKQGSLSQAQLDAIAQVATNTNDIATLQSGKANASHTHSSSDITDIGDYATKQYVDSSISGLVDNAPAALDTLKELSTALNDDANFASTVTTALSAKANSADLATVATSGSYTDLTDKPTIPTNTSDLTNDSDFVVSSNLATVATSGDYDDLSNKPSIPTNTSDLNNDSGFVTLNDFDIPAKTSDLTNDSGFITSSDVPTGTSDLINDSNFVDTSNSAVASGITSAKVTSYDAHIADTDIHVTTADKSKWNNGVSQAYVFRYSSTALVASSTNSNSLLDNTDNLKVGDKVIDSSGVLFSITAIDTANSTFTVGSALIDLALDANVVHTSGDETVAGVKSFSDDTYITSLNFTDEVPSQSSSSSSTMPIITTITYGDSSPSVQARLNLRVTADGIKSLYPHENNQYALGLTSRKWSEVHGVTYYYGSSDTEFSDKFVTTDTSQTITGAKTWTNPQVWSVNCQRRITSSIEKGQVPSSSQARNDYYTLKNGSTTYGDALGVFGCVLSDSNVVSTYFHAIKNVAGSSVRTTFSVKYYTNTNEKTVETNGDIIPTDSTQNLGNSTNKWATINGLEPSSLSMPDLSNGIDISNYFTLGTSSNTYTPSANGWICIKGVSSGSSGIYVESTNGFYCSATHMVDINSADHFVNLGFPVIENEQYTIVLKTVNTSISAKFFPCQGNV